MFWQRVDLSVLDIQDIGWQEFSATWGQNMQLWRPDTVPPGSRYAMLDSLSYESDPLRTDPEAGMAFRVTVLDRAGKPVVGCPVVQGWTDGPQLDPTHAPRGGDPRGRPLKGHLAYTNQDGVAEWTWGPGEGFDPRTSEGAHWIWIPSWLDNSQDYTDVAYGFGWEFGTNHYKMLPTFILSDAGAEPPPEPDRTIQEAIDDAAAMLSDATISGSDAIASAIKLLADAINLNTDEITSLHSALSRLSEEGSFRLA